MQGILIRLHERSVLWVDTELATLGMLAEGVMRSIIGRSAVGSLLAEICCVVWETHRDRCRRSLEEGDGKN